MKGVTNPLNVPIHLVIRPPDLLVRVPHLVLFEVVAAVPERPVDVAKAGAGNCRGDLDRGPDIDVVGDVAGAAEEALKNGSPADCRTSVAR